MQTSCGPSGEQPPSGGPDVARFRAKLFATCWALAALFHLAGNVRPAFVAPSIVALVIQFGVLATAVGVLLRPGSHVRMMLLCGLIPLSAWFEAPIVGNHWVLAAAISFTYLIASAWRPTAETAWEVFAPTARSVVLIAYGFAAFAKLNSDFFDPDVSCAVFYQDQLLRSWGLGVLSASGRPGLGFATALGAAAVEVSVVGLLLGRRTRRAGLLLALAFHWTIALDWLQHFWDFSAVLFAAFLLFLDDAQSTYIEGKLRAVRTPIRVMAVTVAVVACGLIAASTASPLTPVLRGLSWLAGHAVWLLVGTSAFVLVAYSAVLTRAQAPAGALRIAVGPMLLVPALVFFNGLTPYLELKTGFGWNMYSNLRTVDGESNHLVIRKTLDLTGLQADQVEILESSDPALARLIDTDYVLAYSEFREYAHAYPDVSVTYRRAGEVHVASRVGDDAAGAGDVSAVSRRLQSFRVIDTSGRERCQPAYTPAR